MDCIFKKILDKCYLKKVDWPLGLESRTKIAWIQILAELLYDFDELLNLSSIWFPYL